jgi:16S rRNA (cytidine1402-2'-O)-methyltransferase
MYDIDIRTKRFYSLTSFTTKWQFDQYLAILQEEDCGIVSEAGMPWLSDPGKHLIKLCRERNIKMEVLPWANALLPWVIAAYTDTSRFVYMWFPPLKKGRQTFFNILLSYDIPVFIYESVHRIEKTLKQIKKLWFSWEVFLSREISKMYEQHAHGTIDEMLANIENWSIVLKGEFVLWFFSHDKEA